MKQYQRSFAVLAALAIGFVGTARAQQFGVQPLWANYAVKYVNIFYNPLAGAIRCRDLFPAAITYRSIS